LYRLLAPAPAIVLSAAAALAAPQPPPGFNVHLVEDTGRSRFWRGGAPRQDTVQALAKSARARGVTVTFVDLRTPPNSDDRSGKGGRLSPAAQAATAKKLGLRYVSVSALDKGLPGKLQSWQKQGDIYMHCMYGVNRTGFATARFARAKGVEVPTKGLGKRDWKQGEAFQARVGKR
jgi:hypothetical protein